jgi:hypothetical protein
MVEERTGGPDEWSDEWPTADDRSLEHELLVTAFTDGVEGIVVKGR